MPVIFNKKLVQIVNGSQIPLTPEEQQVASDVGQTPHLHANSLCSARIAKQTVKSSTFPLLTKHTKYLIQANNSKPDNQIIEQNKDHNHQ